MKGKAKYKQFRFNIFDFIMCLLAIAFVIAAFWDFGERLHYFPVIFGLGGLENNYIGIRMCLTKHKVIGTVFIVFGVVLLGFCVVLAMNIWGKI